MDNEQEKEKQELQWGEARAQMRITLEIFFVDGGVKLHVKSGKDDIFLCIHHEGFPKTKDCRDGCWHCGFVWP